MSTVKKISKNRQAKMIDGVCAGVADYFQVDVTLVRIIWSVSVFFKGIGIFAYLLCMLLLPAGDEENTKGNKGTHADAGLIGGIILIIFGFFILSSQSDWWGPFRFHYLHDPFRLGYGFWSFMLVAAGITYLIYTVHRNKTTRDDTVKAGDIGKTDAGKTVKRNRDDKWIGGVCSGLAAYADIDPVIVRVGFIILALMSHVWPVVLIYAILLFVLPDSDTE